MTKESKFIIVSNRLPISIGKATDGSIDVKMSSGGLVSGLREVHSQQHSIWVGHCGVFPDDPNWEDVQSILTSQNLAAVQLKKKTYNSYYSGFSNNALWPLSHYFPATMKYSEKDFTAYRKVNETFAQKILDMSSDGDRVWVHDYQLMLLPEMLRLANPNLSVAYFHHIPFPSSEIFRTIPHREELLTGVLGAEYIGFHTFDYARHFLSAATRICGFDVHVDEVYRGEHRSKVSVHPLGVDFEKIEKSANQVQASDHPVTQFLGIDRLDYTKGIVERLSAFRTFLRLYPQWVGKVTFIQLCVPSRTEIASYGSLRNSIERLVGQINGEFAKPGYTPVQYMYRSLPFEEVIRLYKEADVAVVTPLRDGLNLVCKEFVAAKTDEEGVLILSEFAGAASEMGEALLVNPYDVRQVANTMEKAVNLPGDERRNRMRILRDRCRERTNVAWAKSYMDGWSRIHDASQPRSEKLTPALTEQLVRDLPKGKRCFLFLDNDGTLTPIADRPELAVPPPETIEILKSFKGINEVIATIVTGRPRSFCDAYFEDLPINIVAEHGAFARDYNSSEWHANFGLEEFNELKPDILYLLKMYTRFVPGSHIEEKETCLVWHYRQADPELGKMRARELSDSIQSLLGQTSLSVFHGKKSLEIRQVMSNKGYAVETTLERFKRQPGESIFTLGDDVTDEDMHKVHTDANLSIHVGKPNAFAKYYLNSVADVQSLLRNLVDHYTH